VTATDRLSPATNLSLSAWISARKLAAVRAQFRHRGLDPASARGDVGPRSGAYVSNVVDRARMRGENMAQVELALVTVMVWS
jgi:hypothetical protein